MKKAYSLNVRRSKTACIFVVAESAEEAETLALRDIECIYESDFDDDGDEVECEYSCEIDELEPDLKLYDEDLVRMSVSDYLQTLSEEESMMQEGGEE